MFTHSDETPLVFYINDIEVAVRSEIFEWFVRRKPEHFVRALLNHERDKIGYKYELIFTHKKDAMEFKLTFL